MRVLAVLTVLLVAAMCAAVALRPHASTPRSAVARSLDVQSLALAGTRLPLAELRAVLATRIGEPIDDEQLAADRAALERRLEELGYLAAAVHPPVVTFGGAEGGAYVVFDIDRGPQFRIHDVALRGTGWSTVEAPPLVRGEVAGLAALERARAAAEDRLARRVEHPRRVTLDVTPNPALAVADVAFTIRDEEAAP
jgi:outer membrane protein assembly factor BamA